MKKSIAILLIICTGFYVFGCSSPSPDGDNVDATKNSQLTQKEKKIVVGHSFAETNILHLGLLRFSENLARASEGAIKVEVYANAALGNDAEVLQQVRLGNVDCQPISLPFISGEYPQCGIDQLPFLFSSAEHAFAAYDGELGQAIQDEVFSECNIVKIGNVMGQGFRQFTNNKRPIYVPEDMIGIKFRTTESAVRIAMFEACGASVISMPLSELFTALQNGTVDGQENPLSTIDSNGFYEVQKYLSLSNHIFVANFMVMNEDKWNSFTADEQILITEAWNDAVIYERELLKEADEKFIKKFKEAGIEINEVNRDAFVKAVSGVWDSYIKDHGSKWIDLAINAPEAS